jgi:ABC-type multidrug transport system permease subunit
MIKLPLVHIKLPAALSTGASQTARNRQESSQGFQRHIERRHTFNIPAADQMPPKIVSLAAAAITLILPSAVLAVLVSTAVHRDGGKDYSLMLASPSQLSQILPSLTIRSPSAATAPFLASLFSLEAVALFYWIGNGFTLFKMMPWMLALGTVTFFVGRTALGEMRRVRIGKQM